MRLHKLSIGLHGHFSSSSPVDLHDADFFHSGSGCVIALACSSLSSSDDRPDWRHKQSVGYVCSRSRLSQGRGSLHNMSASENRFSFATDNDRYLQYKRKLGSGGFGTVHEVPSQFFMTLISEDPRHPRTKGLLSYS